MHPETRNSTPQPVLLYVVITLILAVAKDIRDRTAPEYRDFFDRLVADIRERGVQVPLIAHREGERLRVIDGETRRLAALMAGTETIPVLVYEQKPDDATLKLAQLLANSLRKDNTPLELAAVYQELMQLNGWTQADLAKATHVSPAQVAKVLAISTKLPPEVQEMVARGELKPRAAYALSRLFDVPKMIDLAKKSRDLAMAVESVEEVVDGMLGSKQKKPAAVKARADGVTLIMPGDWTWQKVKELAEKLKNVALRGEKMDAPLSLLASLLKS